MKKNVYKPYVYKRADELGIPIRDGKDRVLVTVTADDVVNAKKANSKHCALARAALRLPEVNAAYFFRKTAFLEYTNAMLKFELPGSVQKEIVSFDRAQIFAPGIYQLSPPSPSRTIKARKVEAKQKRSERKQRKIEASRKAALAATIAKVAAQDPPNDTLEQRMADAKLSSLEKKHVGGRTVSGIKRADAPEPLPGRAPTRYVHRTQYVRDLREPK